MPATAPVRKLTARAAEAWERLRPSAASDQQDPGARIAASLFGTLLALALIGMIAGFPFWANRAAALSVLLVLAGGSLWGRMQAIRGRQVPAMHAFAVITGTLACLTVATSGRPGPSTLILATVLPSYAAVCGRRPAIAMAALYLVVAMGVVAAPHAGIELPVYFPLPPPAEIAVSALALAGIVGPLAAVYAQLVARTRALAENEERLRLAHAAARQGWFDLDLRNDSVTVSHELATMLGYGPETFRTRRWFDGVHPEDLEAARLGHAAMLRAEQPAGYALRRRGADGEWIWIETLGEVVERDAEGRAARVIGVQTDVTARRQAEESLARYRTHLEELVAERTRELSRAKEAAESASLAKAAFVANMSHEIRTPMNAILGFAYLMREETSDPQVLEHLDHLTASARHLLEVINGILDLSKINAGKMILEERPFAPSAMLEGVVSMLGPLAKAKGLELRVDAQGVPGRAVGDETRLTQSLTNLVSNAIKFTARGGVTIRMRVEEQDADSLLVRFEVVDTGVGIPAEVQSRLFVDFEQADQSTTRAFGGTGLGLAITKRLIAMMGGEVGLQSEPGAGSTFWFTARLRTLQPDATESDTPPDVEALVDDLLAEHLGKRVLLAEDDPTNQKVASAMLRRAGLNVVVAADGAAAVAAMNQGDDTFDLILMDKQMPVLDGIEATRRIRASPGNAKIPVLAMTADAFSEHRDACLAAGMNDFIAKPVDPPQFYATILKWLKAEG